MASPETPKPDPTSSRFSYFGLRWWRELLLLLMTLVVLALALAVQGLSHDVLAANAEADAGRTARAEEATETQRKLDDLSTEVSALRRDNTQKDAVIRRLIGILDEADIPVPPDLLVPTPSASSSPAAPPGRGPVPSASPAALRTSPSPATVQPAARRSPSASPRPFPSSSPRPSPTPAPAPSLLGCLLSPSPVRPGVLGCLPGLQTLLAPLGR